MERKDIFVTTKLWSIFHRPEKVEEAINNSLSKLGLDYVDLYLIHWPVPLNPATGQKFPLRPDGSRDIDTEVTMEQTWAAMEKLYESGKAKAIGVSNWSIPNLERLLKSCKVVPAVNQIEMHRKFGDEICILSRYANMDDNSFFIASAYLPQQKLLDFCASKSIHCTAYSPLGSTNSPLLQDETILKIAEKHNKTPAQVVISWGAARSSVLPKSVTPAVSQDHGTDM